MSMKKLIAIILILACIVCSLTACGNMNLGLGNYTYTHVHISDCVEGHCVDITSWHDNDTGIEVHTNSGSMYLSEGTYQMFSDAESCPYC